MTRLLGVVTLLVATVVVACAGGRPSFAAPTVGFWFEDGAFILPVDVTTSLGGQLKQDEIESVTALARGEIQRAFAGLTIAVTSDPKAFWRVQVLRTLPKRMRWQRPRAAESLALGPLGGYGVVSCDIVALNAVRYAPIGASRPTMIGGIGRGIGRVAVHEFTHQMLGAATLDNDTDESSYEYWSADSSSQYYSDLHWTTAWPLLLQKFGR